MKRATLFTLAFSGAVLFVFDSCKKSSNNGNPSGQYMTANITGNQNFSATNFVGANSIGGQNLDLIGFKISGTDTLAMWLSIPDTLAVGQPGPVPGGTLISYGTYQTIGGYPPPGLSWFENDLDGPGSLTITAWDTTNHTITGTFWGTLYDNPNLTDSLVMSSGKFSMTYVDVP